MIIAAGDVSLGINDARDIGEHNCRSERINVCRARCCRDRPTARSQKRVAFISNSLYYCILAMTNEAYYFAYITFLNPKTNWRANFHKGEEEEEEEEGEEG